MGELDENELAPTTNGSSTPTTDEPKETEKLLIQKSETNAIKKPDTPKSPSQITAEIETPPADAANINIASAIAGAEPKTNGATEEIVNIPEATSTPKNNLIAGEGREVKPKKIPIGGIKMPGFFTKAKPKIEGDGADGELLEKVENDEKPAPTDAVTESLAKPSEKPARPSFFAAFRLRNPFARRSDAAVPVKDDEDNKKEAKVDETNNGKAPVAAEASEIDPSQKKGLLNAIRLPIANIIPKKLRSVASGGDRTGEDLELGNGPNNKAGLASMETLDDSLKDTDNGKDVPDKVANTDDDLETVKLNETAASDDDKKKPKPNETAAEKQSFVEQIRGYQCSPDDWFIFGGILVFILLLGVICAFTFAGSSDVVAAPVRDGKYVEAITSCGLVEGLMEDSAYAFRGIPYAVPPTGDRRWQPAQVLDSIDYCWNGTYKAHNASQVCWQIYANGSMDGTEDCLKLDIVTPQVRYDNPLPVVVLIGAETMTGDSPSRLRPSARYARNRHVIYVRPNFRIGVFGFLALNTLSKSTHPPTSGNYGLSDLIAVLQWIQLNIVHFGGDPKMVTLFGHRAGATLVTALASSPKVNDLYARAWVTSGAALFPGRALPESEHANLEYVEPMKCKDAACLRTTEDEELLDAVPDTWRHTAADLPANDENPSARHEWLVLDGEILMEHPAKALAKQTPGKPRLVIGTTKHESHSEKLFLKHKEWTAELVRKHIEDSKIGQLNLTDEALKRYDATYTGLVSMISDIRTVCPLLTYAQAQPAVPFYVVTQTNHAAVPLATVDDDAMAIMGRYEPKTPEQRRFVSAIQQMFYHYVAFGEMNMHEARVFRVGQDALAGKDYPNCDFWVSKDVVPRYGRID